MQGARSRILYRRSNGQPSPIRDENLLGSGGEGSIYALDQLPDLVAKVYHSPGGETGAKLALMVDNPPTMPEREGHVSIAWPLDTLHSSLPARPDNTVGFLMHRISSMQPVSQCYNPAARKRNFPHFTYRHLCAVAINIAIAVNAVHGRNYVIGDINESNILVDDRGLVTLIDTDSFQVIDPNDGTIYRSPVGKPEYTPPELQGHRFDSVDRNEYHDRFGLGVIVFQLLMEGRHPYAGRFTGLGEPPAIEDNIASGHFLYSESRAVPLVEGPGYLPWQTVDGSIAELFRLCFDRGHDNQIVRPTAFQWEEAIAQAVGSFATCTRTSSHQYFGHNSACPWCNRRDMLRGRDPFPEASGPEPLLMRTAAAGPPPPAGRAPPPPQPQPRPPPPAQPARPQTRATVHQPSSLRGIPMPSNARSTWAVLLLIVLGLSLISWGVASLVNFLESDPLGSDGPPSTANSLPPRLPLPPTSVPATGPAVAMLPPTETPSPIPTVSPAPTITPSSPAPTSTTLAASPPSPAPESSPTVTPPPPTPTPIPPVPPHPTATPTNLPTPTREPIPVKPDLTLDVASFAWRPERPSVGDPITFSISVRNHGGHAAPSRLGYRIYSVANHIEPVSEGNIDVPDIPAGDHVEVSFDWMADPGHHTIEIDVDVTDHLDETAETNNTATNLLYDGTALADLVAGSITWLPEIPAVGDSIVFLVVFDNKGEGRSAPSRVQLYLNNEPHGEADLSGILPGESGMATFDWTAQVGTSILTVVADSGNEVAEADEDNNELTITYNATTFVDLTVQEISWEPPSPSVGDDVTFSVVVQNQGTLDAAESTVELSGLPTDGAEFVGEAQLVSIPAGGWTTTTFPWRAQAGAFALTAHADAHQEIIESNEDNNELEAPYDATALADLVVTDISWNPASPAVGEQVTVAVHVENRGVGTSLPSDVRLYVDDTQNGEDLSLPGLSSMDSHSVSFTWSAEIGRHSFQAHVDRGDRVVETDETNNGSETFVYDDTRVADLRVRSVQWRPENPSVGDTVDFMVTIENRGDASARDFHVSFRDTSSVWPPIERVVPDSIGAGQSATVNFDWPADADPHQFEIVADSQATVTESNEDNNDLTIDYAATVAADLTVTRVTATPRRPSIDEDTIIKVFIENKGRGRAVSFIVTLNISGPDIPLDEVNRRVDGLDAGTSTTLEFPWTARAVSHTFTATADSRGVIPETDESNNVLEETVLTALSDLRVTEVHIGSPNPSAGDRVEVGVRIENGGRGDSGRFTAALYIGGVDEPYDTTRMSSLEPNTSAYIEFTWQAVEGCHSLYVIVDESDDVPEEDEGNNRSQEVEICTSGSQ